MSDSWVKKRFTTNEGFPLTEVIGSAPPFSPTQISGVTAFWNFGNSSALTLFSNKIGTCGDPVSGADMTQSTDANRPSFTSSGGFNNRGYATFNGTSSYLISGFADYFGSNKLSIAVRFAAAPQDNGSLLGYKLNNQNPYFYFLSGDAPTNSAKLLTRVSDNTNGISLFSTTDAFIDTSTWRTCVMTFDGTFVKQYINSSSVDANNSGSLNMNSSTEMLMGARDNGPAIGFLNGKIDYVAIFSRDLNSTEVGQLINYGS